MILVNNPLLLRFVCREWRDMIKIDISNVKKFISHVVQNEDINILNWAKENGCPLFKWSNSYKTEYKR